MIIELLTFCRSGTGQCTHCRGGAESVLTLSLTVIGVGLHRLGANLTRRKGKYTSGGDCEACGDGGDGGDGGDCGDCGD